jgi:hypothetical protein
MEEEGSNRYTWGGGGGRGDAMTTTRNEQAVQIELRSSAELPYVYALQVACRSSGTADEAGTCPLRM